MTTPLTKNKTRFSRVFLLTTGLLFLIVGVVCALRHIWPFGDGNISYVDTSQYYVPGYYSLWDFFHGNSLRINWNTGLGEYGKGGLSYLFYPTTWVWLLVPRDHILEGLTLYLLANLLLVDAVASWVVSRRFPSIGTAAGTAIALTYTLSGFALQYYSNYSWFDYVALFPLILWGLERLLKDGKWGLYAAALTLCLCWSIYFGYMICLYIIFFSALYLLFMVEKPLRGRRTLTLGLTTALSLGLSACKTLHSGTVIVDSSRFQDNVDEGLLSWFTTADFSYIRHTVLMLVGLELAVVLAVTAYRAVRRADTPEVRRWNSSLRLFAGMAIVFAVPMFLPNVDTLWHFGPHNFFPMRYGYMLSATALAAGGAALEALPPETLVPPAAEASSRRTLRRTGLILCLAAAVALMIPVVRAWHNYGACFLDCLTKNEKLVYYPCLVGAAALWCVFYRLLLSLRTHRRLLALCAVTLQLGICAFGLIGADDSTSHHREFSEAYVHEADTLYEVFSDMDLGVFDRVKNPDTSLHAGYSTIAGISSLSSRQSANSSGSLEAAELLGYTTNYFLIFDGDGTVFSDMLLGVRYAVTRSEPDEALYSPLTTAGELTISESLYTADAGLLFPAGALDGYYDGESMAERLELLYTAFTGKTGAAFTPDYTYTFDDTTMTGTLTFHAGDAQFVYFSATHDILLMNITANGETILVPSYGNENNTSYPAQFNGGSLFLGEYENEDVTITFMAPVGAEEEQLELLSLDRAAMASFNEDATFATDYTLTRDMDTLTITLTAEEDGQRLWLPLRYGTGLACTVNGQSVTTERAAGLVSAIPLQRGENEIVITTGKTNWFSRGRLITAGTVVVLAVYLLLRRRDIRWLTEPPTVLSKIAMVAFFALCIVLFVFIYIAPPAAYVLSRLMA